MPAMNSAAMLDNVRTIRRQKLASKAMRSNGDRYSCQHEEPTD